jgi:methionyl-tRNA synthetase
VRQLRQPARPDRPDQPAQPKINGEVPEFVETEHFFLDLPALAEPRAWLGHAHRLAPERHPVP